MKIIDFNIPNGDAMNIALGHFDAIHNGHLSLINECRKGGARCGVFLFDRNPLLALGREAKVVHTLTERLKRLELLRVDYAVIARADKELLSLECGEFVAKLCRFNINKAVAGADYSFGRGGEGGANRLTELLSSRGVDTVILPLMNASEGKISTAGIHGLIERGEVAAANKLMPIPYTVAGIVARGRQVGRTFGIPTANLEINADKLLPPDGVYAALVRVSGEVYAAVTNIGARPTFDCGERTIESFIIGFDSDIYETEIELFLLERLRGVRKFSGADKLREQILIDADTAREIAYGVNKEFLR